MSKEKIGIAAALIEDGHHRFLLQLRDDKPDIECPGHWGLFGGHIEPGETPKEAVIRELREELCVNVNPGKLNFFGKYDNQSGRITYVFVYRGGDEIEDANLREGQRIGRFSGEELKTIAGNVLDSHPVVPSLLEIFDQFFRKSS